MISKRGLVKKQVGILLCVKEICGSDRYNIESIEQMVNKVIEENVYQNGKK